MSRASSGSWSRRACGTRTRDRHSIRPGTRWRRRGERGQRLEHAVVETRGHHGAGREARLQRKFDLELPLPGRVECGRLRRRPARGTSAPLCPSSRHFPTDRKRGRRCWQRPLFREFGRDGVATRDSSTSWASPGPVVPTCGPLKNVMSKSSTMSIDSSRGLPAQRSGISTDLPEPNRAVDIQARCVPKAGDGHLLPVAHIQVVRPSSRPRSARFPGSSCGPAASC